MTPTAANIVKDWTVGGIAIAVKFWEVGTRGECSDQTVDVKISPLWPSSQAREDGEDLSSSISS